MQINSFNYLAKLMPTRSIGMNAQFFNDTCIFDLYTYV